MPDATELLAFSSELAPVEAVRALVDAERGFPSPNVMATGGPPPPGVPSHTLHACDLEAVLSADGKAVIGYAHPPPAKPLPLELAAKVTMKTRAELTATAEPVEQPKGGP